MAASGRRRPLPQAARLLRLHFSIWTCLCRLVLTVLHHEVFAFQEILIHGPTWQIKQVSILEKPKRILKSKHEIKHINYYINRWYILKAQAYYCIFQNMFCQLKNINHKMSITWESNFGSVTVNALHKQTSALFSHFLTLHSRELEEPPPSHVQRVVCNEQQVKGRTLLLTGVSVRTLTAHRYWVFLCTTLSTFYSQQSRKVSTILLSPF